MSNRNQDANRTCDVKMGLSINDRMQQIIVQDYSWVCGAASAAAAGAQRNHLGPIMIPVAPLLLPAAPFHLFVILIIGNFAPLCV